MEDDASVLKYRKALAHLADMYAIMMITEPRRTLLSFDDLCLLQKALVCLINEDMYRRKRAIELMDRITGARMSVLASQSNDLMIPGVQYLKWFFDEFEIDANELVPYSNGVV